MQAGVEGYWCTFGVGLNGYSPSLKSVPFSAMLRKHLLSGEKIENTMKRMAFLVVGLLVTAITVTVFIISAPPSFDIAEVLGEEGVFDKLDNGLYIAVLKEENVNDNFFDGLCVAILRNVTDTELVSLIAIFLTA